ncbi:MAG: tetratricopeptide repeat protein, partial [Gallionella sp.]
QAFHKTAQLLPEDAVAHYNLGVAQKSAGRLDEAVASYRRAISLKPDYFEAHYNLGNALKSLGQQENAAQSYRRAVQLRPDHAEAHYSLGIVLQNLDQLDGAVASYRRALQLKPDNAEAHNDLGNALLDLGLINDAIASYRRALEVDPDHALAYNNLGNPLKNLGQLDDAIASYRRAVEIKPEFAEAYCNLGAALRIMGDLSTAEACYRKAQELGYNAASVCNALMLPDIMGTQQQVMDSRARFERGLDSLISDGVKLRDPLSDVGETNFYLAYHGLNDRDLQIKVAKFYEQACPSLLYVAPHCVKPRSAIGQKIRVGFISRYFYGHPVSFCFGKMIEALSSDSQFDVSLISNHPVDPSVYSEFAGRQLRLPYNLAQARKIIAELELDILVYLDIGMEPLSYFLAFSRLAPAQCVFAGHPVTTGISNIDYFLSTDVMEPSDADQHYSEKLVRFPKPPVYFTRPTIPATLKTRQELGLPENRHIYMCPMKLQKLHPDFDEAMTRILQMDNNGVIVLFEDCVWTHWKTALLDRFERTVPAEVRERIIFLPWLKDSEDFISAIASADVVLDPFHFGIGSTVAVSCVTGTPLVTRRGKFMRGRVGAYYCELMGLPECVALDNEGYARKAVGIASDPISREKIRAKILKNNSLVYEDRQAIETLVEFFDTIAADTRFDARST